MSVYLFHNQNRIDAFCMVSKNEKIYIFETDNLYILFLDSIIYIVEQFQKMKKI